MTLTLPVAMKAVGTSNQELVRNTTSYISLAAIHNGKALSHYALQIISYIINGEFLPISTVLVHITEVLIYTEYDPV